MNLLNYARKEVHDQERALLAAQKFLALCERLSCQVSDLRWHAVKWNHKVIASPSVLARCERAFIESGLGSDGSTVIIVARPYFKYEDALGEATVSYTESFAFGEDRWGWTGTHPDAHWQEEFETRGVPLPVIEQVRQFLLDNAPEEWSETEKNYVQ